MNFIRGFIFGFDPSTSVHVVRRPSIKPNHHKTKKSWPVCRRGWIMSFNDIIVFIVVVFLVKTVVIRGETGPSEKDFKKYEKTRSLFEK